MDKLAHPLRQEILIFIFDVATGTLYHHLNQLKGLIIQDELKQYKLTKSGKSSLDFLFGESNNIGKNRIGDEKVEKPSFVEIIKTDGQLKNELNISKIYHNLFSLPVLIYNSIIGIFLILSTAIIMLEPKIVFFHFIPINISENWAGIIPIIWIVISICLFLLVYLNSKIKPNLANYSLFLLYHNIYLFLILSINIFSFLQVDVLYQVFSIIFQVLYIIIWVFLLSYDCWTWERSLVTVLLQNYGFLLVVLI
ncbi:MAG: hypothetical protein ACW967_10190 [Candidatus Hodarchaeales archaeon]